MVPAYIPIPYPLQIFIYYIILLPLLLRKVMKYQLPKLQYPTWVEQYVQSLTLIIQSASLLLGEAKNLPGLKAEAILK